MQDADAAAARATELLGDVAEAEEETPSSPEEPVAEEVAQPEAEVSLDLDPELPDDVAEFLSEPDFDTDEEPQALEEETEFEYEEDTEKAELKRELTRAKKEAEHYKKLRLTQDRAKWEAEAKKYAPLSEPFLAKIKADSRRSYLRQAKEYHEAIKPLVEERIVKPLRDALDAERAKVTEEARSEAEQAWGRPSTGPGVTPVEASERQARYEKAAKTGDLVAMIKARAFGGGEE